MHTFSDMMKAVNRSAVFLRMLNVSEELLREAWCIEKKLLQILKLDLNDSQTWFLDSCGETTNKSRRLLLTNHDLGFELTARTLQLGLNFDTESPELFAGKEMG